MNIKCVNKLLFFSLFFFVSCASNLPKSNLTAVSQEGSDTVFYADLLAAEHIGFKKLVSEDVFYEKVGEAVSRLDAMYSAGESDEKRRIALYYELCKLAAMLHDGHTSIELPQDVVPFLEVYPYATSVVGGELVILSVGKGYEDCLGKTIVEFNGRNIDEVINAVKSYISFDTEAYATSKVSDNLNIRQMLDYAGINAEDGVVRMKFSDGSEASFAPVLYSKLSDVEFVSYITQVARTLYVTSSYECYDLSADCLFMQYNACQNADGYSVSDFSEFVLNAIDNMGFSKLIIDLRFNGGGNSMLLDPFIGELKTRIKQGKCKGYVLIGTNTFSSAVLNAWGLKKAGCMLVGTPTGGAINHYGELGTCSLPESGINVYYSTKHFVLDSSAPPGSIEPDFFVDNTIEDYLNCYDAQVAACLLME